MVIRYRTYDSVLFRQQERKPKATFTMGYSFQVEARGILYVPSHRLAVHTTAFVIPVVEHWLDWEIVQWVHHKGSIQRTMSKRSYHGATSRSRYWGKSMWSHYDVCYTSYIFLYIFFRYNHVNIYIHIYTHTHTHRYTYIYIYIIIIFVVFPTEWEMASL